jgi:toxin FitB
MVAYLLDTNVVSETTKPDHDPNVRAWLRSIPIESQFLSVLSHAEILRGILRLPESKRRSLLMRWLTNDLREWFGERVLPIDSRVGDAWAELTRPANRPLPQIDSLIAATALANNLVLVTRDTALLRISQIESINPWQTQI